MTRFVEVEFADQRLWVTRAFMEGKEHDSPLAPPHHIADGDLDFETCFDGATFAHVYRDDGIMRFHQKIGEVSDLQLVQPAPVDA